jgi:DNA primase
VSGIRTPAFEARVERARNVPIERELERRGVRLRGTGRDRVGPCPNCGGDDRFGICTAKQVFNCRVCGTGGNVIKLVEHLDGVDFITACTMLAGEPPPRVNGQDRTGEPRKIVATEFHYSDQSGALRFVVERLELLDADGSPIVTKEGSAKRRSVKNGLILTNLMAGCGMSMVCRRYSTGYRN